MFDWGRKYYENAAWVEAQLAPKKEDEPKPFDRVAELRAYQDAAYARTYTDFLERIEEPRLREIVARYLYKLMAYKDEYEVARLLTKPDFERKVKEMWAAPEAIFYNLHPPFLRRFGLMKKITPGPWFRVPLKMLAAMKSVRGSALDVFLYSRHRRMERSLIDWYKRLIGHVMANLTEENLPLALEIAALPDQIRGYETIKEANVAKVKALAEEMLQLISAPRTAQPSSAPV